MKVVITYHAVVEFDAVGNDIAKQYECLRKEGVPTYIYTERYDECFREMCSENALDLLNDKDTILIYHHAGYWERGLELLKSAKCKKVVKYHNTTPERFFRQYSNSIFEYCQNGRKQISEIIDAGIDLLISDSEFNSQDFLERGFQKKRCRTLAPFHSIYNFNGMHCDIRTLDKLSDGRINVFFVSRIAPNKGHKSILNTAFYYKQIYGNNIRFVIAGGLDPELNGYYDEITSMADRLQLDDVVEFVGRVSFPELKSYYAASHIFLLLSEHEGFCVPILEAQYFKLPIVALGTSAIKETLGENQLVYDSLDYETLAASIHTLANELKYKKYLVDNGSKNFLKYQKDNLENKLIDYLNELN